MKRFVYADGFASCKGLFLNRMKKNEIILFGCMKNSLPCRDQINCD
jgi:hypothetical protein